MIKITKDGSIECVLPGGVGGFDSNSDYKFFDVWCDYFFFSITSRQPFVKQQPKEYVHAQLYMVNIFNNSFKKVFSFGKYIFVLELEHYAHD